MMKLLSGEWLAAEAENKAIRDAKRKEFWADLGIVPAKNTGDIDLTPSDRMGRFQALVEKTLSGREGNAELAAITRLAGSLVADLAPGSFSHGGSSFALDMTRLTPQALRAFFLSEDLTSYEVSESN